jgi:hypothetical protein
MQLDRYPGDVSPRVYAMIVTACIATVVLAFSGMRAMWEYVEWVQEPYFEMPGRDAFWFTTALGLATCAALAIAWWPAFRIARVLRVALALPIVHLVALVVAAVSWSLLKGELWHDVMTFTWRKYDRYVAVSLPSLSLIAAAFATMVLVAIAIKRRHGEWAHATVMLALSYLLLIGLWLPIVSRLAISVDGGDWSWAPRVERVLDAEQLARTALLPPAFGAIAFTVLAFRTPQLFARMRSTIRIATRVMFGIAMIVALTLPDKGWLVYLESSYLVMFGIALAIASLLLLGCVSWIGSVRANRRSKQLTYIEGMIAYDEEDEVARFEITSSLRGPRLVTRPFVVTTAHGNIPVSGAKVLAPVPAETTTLEIGEHTGVLAPGDRVVIAARSTTDGGHPFRSSDATDVLLVASQYARSYRLSDIVLVGWRPALAYLAILTAVAAPFLSIFLTA